MNGQSNVNFGNAFFPSLVRISHYICKRCGFAELWVDREEDQRLLLKSWASDLPPSIEDVPLLDELRYALGDVPSRTDADDLITSSETATVPFVSRMVYARRPTSEQMLGAELQRFGHDRVFEEALRFATRLLP